MALADFPLEQQMVLATVGDLAPLGSPMPGEPVPLGTTGLAALLIPSVWSYWSGIVAAQFGTDAVFAPQLRQLYATRHLLGALIGLIQDEVNVSIGQGGRSESLSDRARLLRQRFADTVAEITRLEKRAAASRPMQVGLLTTTQPIAAPQPGDFPVPDWSDASSPVYTGSPYWPGNSPSFPTGGLT